MIKKKQNIHIDFLELGVINPKNFKSKKNLIDKLLKKTNVTGYLVTARTDVNKKNFSFKKKRVEISSLIFK